MQFVRHDPLLLLGFLRVALSGVLSLVVIGRLAAGGYKTHGYFAMWPMIGTVPLAYLYLRGKITTLMVAWPA